MKATIDMIISAGTRYRACLEIQTIMQDNDMLTIQFETGSDMAILNLNGIQESHAESELCSSIGKALEEYKIALDRRIKVAVDGR